MHALYDLVVEFLQLFDAARPLGRQLFAGGQAFRNVLQQEGRGEVDDAHDPGAHDIINTRNALKQKERGGCQ